VVLAVACPLVLTAAAMIRGSVLLHNPGERFSIEGQVTHAEKLTPDQILQLLKNRAGHNGVIHV
jgi:hypothetical protein